MLNRTELVSGQTVLFAKIDVSSANDNTIVAANSTKKIKVLHYTLVVDADVTVRWRSNTTDLTGAMSFLAKGGIASPVGFTGGGHLLETAVNEPLNLYLGGGVGVRGHISYYLEGV